MSVEDVMRLHSLAIEDQHGDHGLRDATLLESAVMTPRQQFDGQFLHPDIPSMAAAYAYHICKNHPFVDGNKRAGTAAMIAFLSDNGWSFDATADQAEPVILSLAAGTLEKPDLTAWVRQMTHEKPKLDLRDFFARLDYKALALMAEGAIAGQLTEQVTTLSEAAEAIPAIAVARDGALVCAERGDNSTADALRHHMWILTAIYRIAEDMGYEW